jgi:hypothetical protein
VSVTETKGLTRWQIGRHLDAKAFWTPLGLRTSPPATAFPGPGLAFSRARDLLAFLWSSHECEDNIQFPIYGLPRSQGAGMWNAERRPSRLTPPSSQG